MRAHGSWWAIGTLVISVVVGAVSRSARPGAASESRGGPADFDYLLGEWEFTTVSRDFGEGEGVWTAVRLEGGSILDEYRVVGDTGQTWYHSVTLRAFNARTQQWDLVSVDGHSGLMNAGTARRAGAEMHIEQRFGMQTERPVILRIKYYDIRPNAFSWTADRSSDGGKTWSERHLQIEARRVGPAREMPSLAPVRRRPGTQ
jgi:hypothetical protein